MVYLIIALVVVVCVAWYNVDSRDKEVNVIAVGKEAIKMTAKGTKIVVQSGIPLAKSELQTIKSDYDYGVAKGSIQYTKALKEAGEEATQFKEEVVQPRIDRNKRYVKVMTAKTLKVTKRNAAL